MRQLVTVLFLPVALYLSSCSTESSSKFATDQIEAEMHADVDAVPGQTKTKIFVLLKDGSTDITLGDGDALTAKTNKDEKLVLKKNFVNFYDVEIPSADREDLTISFTRTSGTSAPNSTIKLLAAVVLTAPTGSPKPTASFAAGKVDLEWSNKIDNATVSFYTRPCGTVSGGVGGTSPSGADSGKFSLKMSDLGVSAAPPAGGTCISIDIERKVRSGVVDPAFKKDSSFEGKRQDRYDIQVMP